VPRKRGATRPSWMNVAMLAIESQQVIFLRLAKLASGGAAARKEADLMVSEKVKEAINAGQRMMLGATPDSVIQGYRKKVRANARRLRK